MRKVDWNGPLSKEDITWLRQAGMLYVNGGLPIEDAIRFNQQQFSSPEVAVSESDDEGEDDDYDEWNKADLEAEVEKRRKIAPITVEGSGQNGNVVKADLIKALRVWDQENLELED